MDLRNYILVTAAYWGFTLTDGALRTLVLLHFHELGFSPIHLAFLFLLYELAGIVTNALGGWLANTRGLRLTLLVGLALQVVALVALSAVSPTGLVILSVSWVMACQALSGIAKDLTKMSSKSAIKVVLPAGAEGRLFQWVAVLTGSKNALKGVGFFLGGLLLDLVGFRPALWLMAGGLALVLAGSIASLPRDLGKAKEAKGMASIFANSRGMNLLALARLFLFGSRDAWFVVGVPVFLAHALEWDFWQVSGFLGLWTIGYGIVQGAAPKALERALGGRAPGPGTTLVLALALIVTTAAMPLLLAAGVDATTVILVGLGIYGVVFALNSSVHSYLVLAYAERDEVATRVGFYYAANAAGRLLGTLASGLLALLAGLPGCLWGSVAFLAVTVVATIAMPAPESEKASPALPPAPAAL